jgi:hypothetical protein
MKEKEKKRSTINQRDSYLIHVVKGRRTETLGTFFVISLQNFRKSHIFFFYSKCLGSFFSQVSHEPIVWHIKEKTSTPLLARPERQYRI